MKEEILKEIEGPLKEIGVEVYDITFAKEDGVDTLFITIDSDKEVDTNLCETSSKIISPLLDKLDIKELQNEYILDVCSKGEENE